MITKGTDKGKYSKCIKKMVDVLNDALEKDPEGMNNLINTRVICNEQLAEHPTIQVGAYKPGSDEFNKDYPEGETEFKIGFLGMINGISQAMGYVIYAEYDSETKTYGKLHYKNNEAYFKQGEN
jgi:hypothetical protein